MVQFNQVPADLKVPFVAIEIDGSNADPGFSRKPYRALIIGPRNPSTSTVAPLQPTRILGDGQAEQAFGAGSILAAMVKRWRSVNRFTELWAIATPDTDFVAARRLLTISGPATGAGSLYAYIGGRRYVVPVASGATGTVVATALKARIDNDPDALVTTSDVGGTDNAATIEITAKSPGVLGAEIRYAWNHNPGEAFPAGITASPNFASPNSYGGLGGASGEPDLDQVWTAIGPDQYDVIVQPWTTATALASTRSELEDRWGPMKQTDGVAVTAINATAAAAITFGEGLNDKHLVCLSSFRTPTPVYELASQVAAIVALEGPRDPALPFQRVEVPDMVAPNPIDRPPLETLDLMLRAGIATTVSDEFGTVRIQRLVTTSKTNEFGIDSEAYFDLNTVLTLSFLRWSANRRILQKYPRHKLANDGTRFAPGQRVVTPATIKAELIALYSEWELIGLVEGVEAFKEALVVERDLSDPNRVNVQLRPDLTNQLRVVGVQIAFLL